MLYNGTCLGDGGGEGGDCDAMRSGSFKNGPDVSTFELCVARVRGFLGGARCAAWTTVKPLPKKKKPRNNPKPGKSLKRNAIYHGGRA
jgi:hypothetical protein